MRRGLCLCASVASLSNALLILDLVGHHLRRYIERPREFVNVEATIQHVENLVDRCKMCRHCGQACMIPGIRAAARLVAWRQAYNDRDIRDDSTAASGDVSGACRWP